MKHPPLCRRPTPPTYCAAWALRRMRPGKRAALFLLMVLSSLSLTGCLTIGPVVEVRHILIHPGQPLRVMENITVRGERMDGGGAAEHDVGGWVMMPPDHWAAVSALIKPPLKVAAP